MKTQKVPDFRYKALEYEFCKFMTGVCVILKEFGTLDQSYDIKQMLETLKTDEWEDIIPYAYYLHPLKKLAAKMRKTLLGMDVLGPLRMKYIIENNTELMAEVKAMVKQDNIVQWLMHD